MIDAMMLTLALVSSGLFAALVAREHFPKTVRVRAICDKCGAKQCDAYINIRRTELADVIAWIELKKPLNAWRLLGALRRGLHIGAARELAERTKSNVNDD
jgi:hypothetical protein